MTSRRQLYALGEPFGESATRIEGHRRIYGGGGGGTSVTRQEIPAELKPLASAYTNKAIGLSSQGFQPYWFPRNADLNSTQNLGLGMVTNRALNGSPLERSAQSAASGMLNAGTYNPANATAGTNPYLGMNNPYLEKSISSAQSDAYRAMNPMFQQQQAQSGSFGNSGLAEAQTRQMTETMGNISTQARMQDYAQQQGLAENAVNRQLQTDQFNIGNDMAGWQQSNADRLNAMQLAPGLAQMDYNNASQLLNAGQIQQDQAQKNLDFAYERFQEQQNLPYKQLAAMAGVFGSGLGSSSTTTQSGGGGGK